MAHHLIFVDLSTDPKVSNDKEEVFKRMGLEDHILGCDAMQIPAEESPSGNAGFLYAWRSKGDDQIIVRKDQQEWMKSAAGYWVGVWKDKMPTEQQLRRTYTQNGEWIEFGRSHETWKMPTPTTIDQRIALSDDGTWTYQPIRELAWYGDEMSKRKAACEIEDEGGEITINVLYDMFEATSLIVRVLRINYRMTPEVCHLMDMFTQRNVSHAYGRMMGLTFQE